jgi:alpha-galactosidase
MLKGLGFSYRLPDLPAKIRERLRFHIEFYKTILRGLIFSADFFRLTGQAIRGGLGERWNAFQYMDKDGKSGVVFVFRLDKSEDQRIIKLLKLKPSKYYTISFCDLRLEIRKQGTELLNQGLTISLPEEESSEIIFFKEE